MSTTLILLEDFFCSLSKFPWAGGINAKSPFVKAREHGPQRIGSYYLGKTLGVGSKGRVKLGTHMTTSQRVAIKIILKDTLVRKNNTESLEGAASHYSDTAATAKRHNLNEKTESEITIMKLIQHPNVMQLYDVYESEKEVW
ncbi:hypothetical protein BC830DRAFT_809286 [Chytriomyces sp. MP71]|nr:hypothetical protein BC830DRAFT_809286 [Chytriomyces sp. MP71]